MTKPRYNIVYYTALNPPSRFITQLFAYSLLAKNTAASAISSGAPNRPSGMLSFNLSFCPSLKSAIIGVSIYPGTIAFDRTTTLRRESAASTVNDLVRPRSPAFEAAYGTAPVPPFSASNDEMFMIHLDSGRVSPVRLFSLLRREARRRARDVKIAPSRFVRRVCEISSGDVLGRIFEWEIPAALIRMSTDC